MKRIYTLLVALLLTLIVNAQSPDKMSYQAVIRDGNNQVVSNAYIATRISLLKGAVDGSALYTEIHTGTTNVNGLLTLIIGAGTSADDFSSINWSEGPYFIKTETDPSGGDDYSISATSQLLSVPYALYSKKAENGIDAGSSVGAMNYWNGTAWVEVAPTVNEGATLQFVGGVPTWTGGTAPRPKIGDTYAGGIVFYVADTPTDLDGDGDLDSGLVCATEDHSSVLHWWNGSYSITGATDSSVGGGAYNTAKIIITQGEGIYAASVARAYKGGGFGDWFLPSVGELNLMFVNLKSKGLGGSLSNEYWSSTEFNNLGASFEFYRDNGSMSNPISKYYTTKVRVVRAFTLGDISTTVNEDQEDDETTTIGDEDQEETFGDLPEIGDTHAGGIVFYIAETLTDLDGDGVLDRGLVCATEDQSSGVNWHNQDFISTGATDTSIGSGASNTAAIIATQGEGVYAASVANAYRGGGFDNWFLPSKDELNLMYSNLKSKGVGGFLNRSYWSASEGNSNNVWLQSFYFGDQNELNKFNTLKVRAVRAF